MKHVIKVKTKNVYGNDLIYPVCDLAKLFCDIAGSKTFTNRMIERLKRDGFLFVEEKLSIL